MTYLTAHEYRMLAERPAKRRKQRPEQALQIALVKELRACLPEPWLVFHIPNGGGRSKVEAGILKGMGTLAGMPDLMVVGFGVRLDSGQSWTRIIAIECKAPKGSLSKAQKATIERLGRCGVPTLIAKDAVSTFDALQRLGVPV